jgi:soluble lytic murein transglycosylase-like protein
LDDITAEKEISARHTRLNGLLRISAAPVLGACMLFTSAVPIREAKPMAISESQIRAYLDMQIRERVRKDVARMYAEAECAKLPNGDWNAKKLAALQKRYFTYLRTNSKYMITDGIPNSIIDLMPLISHIGEMYDLSPMLIASIIKNESYGYPFAIGSKGEMGLMQINPNANPKIFRDKQIKETIFNPEVNITIGTEILARDIASAGGNVEYGLTKYNVGQERLGNIRLKACGRSYAKNVLSTVKKIEFISTQ